MSNFVQFRHKSNGVIASYPEDYATHPVFGYDLERYYPENEEFEEDKVVTSGHELPVDQRATKTATKKDED